MRMRSFRAAACALMVSLGLVAESAPAADRVWSGLSVNANFGSGANWAGGVAPAANDNVFFSSPSAARSVVLLNTNPGIAALVVSGNSAVGSYDLRGGGSSLTISGTFGVATLTAMSITNNAVINAGLVFPNNNSAVLINNATLNGTDIFSNGHMLVQSGASLNAGSALGLLNNGRLSVTGGGDVTANDYIDFGNQGAANVLVDGPGSTVTAGSLVTSTWGFSNGAASVTISNSASVTYNAGLGVANFGSLSSASLLLNSGGQLRVAGALSAGGAGEATLVISGGSFSVGGPGFLSAGTRVNLDTAGFLEFQEQTSFFAGAFLNVKNGGTLNVAAGKSLNFDGGTALFQTNSFTIPAGSIFRVRSGGEVEFQQGPLHIGRSASPATGALAIDSGFLEVTNSGTSEWAVNAGNTATVSFTNNGSAEFAGPVHVAGNGGNALILQDSGRFKTGGLILGGAPTSSVFADIDGGTFEHSSLDFRSGSTITFSAGTMITNGAIQLSGNARLRLTPTGNKILRSTALTVASTSRLDLANNAAIVNYSGASPLAAITSSIATGYNNGNWLGNGLTSTSAAINGETAIGIVDTAQSGSPGTFLGQPVDGTTILMRYTLYGDSNLDGTVGIGDFASLAANFNAVGSSWFRGDYNYDGTTNIADFALLAGNFNQSLSDLPRTAIPEPGAVAMLGAVMVLIRRRGGARSKLQERV